MPASDRTIMGYIGRSLVILIAFALACLVAVIVLLSLGTYWMSEALLEGQPDNGDMGVAVHYFSLFFGSVEFASATLPILSLLPALLLIIIGEVARIRGFYYYVVGGGLALAALPFAASPSGAALNPQMMAVFATAGFAGGGLYWLLAGRRA